MATIHNNTRGNPLNRYNAHFAPVSKFKQTIVDLVICSVVPLSFAFLLLLMFISTGHTAETLITKSSFGVFKKVKQWTTATGDDVRIEQNKQWERHTLANNNCKIIMYEKRG
jgi:hypothetical protein